MTTLDRIALLRRRIASGKVRPGDLGELAILERERNGRWDSCPTHWTAEPIDFGKKYRQSTITNRVATLDF